MATAAIDYYEFLQISPNAEVDTIHRVYRYLAARFHPDNQQSGDVNTFSLLKKAYDVLSDPSRRAKYDASRRLEPIQPLSSTIDFMDQMEGELNRRLAVLAVLYYRRRTNPNYPEISLAEIEERMGFPREYLDFTLWYLAKKGYIGKADNAQYALTAEGVDFVETQRANLPILGKLLTSGSGSSVAETMHVQADDATSLEAETTTMDQHTKAPKPIIMRAPANRTTEWHEGMPDRRVGMPDRRIIKTERRRNVADRRADQMSQRKIG